VATSTEVAAATDEPEEDEGLHPLPDRLVTELTSYRTVALREALGRNPEVAFLATLHALCLRVFYHYGLDSCIELDLKSVVMTAPGLADTAAATAISARHPILAHHLPTDPAELWDTLVGFDADLLGRLFAHCIAQGVNAVLEPWNRKPRSIAHADRLATAVGLDMAAQWQPTAENFFGRVTKARIAEAVQEAKGQAAAEAIAGLKKDAMAERAEELLAGSGWLPEPLRTPGVSREPNASEGSVAIDSEPAMEPDVDIADTEALTSGGFAEAAE
jgi:ParB family chromosome partitioning protein